MNLKKRYYCIGCDGITNEFRRCKKSEILSCSRCGDEIYSFASTLNEPPDPTTLDDIGDPISNEFSHHMFN